MNKVALSFALSATLAVAVSQALVCDPVYHWQAAYERILSGKTTGSLTLQSTKTLDKTMGGATVLHDDTKYEMFTDFDGSHACETWNPTIIDMAYRQKGDAAMTTRRETAHFTKLNSGNYPSADSIPLDYWFGFTTSKTSEPISIYEVIGKSHEEARLHVWYGNAVMKESVFVKDVGTPRYNLTYRFTQLNNHADSATLQKQLTEGWKTFTDNDTQHISIKVQLIKIYFDSIPSPGTDEVREVKANTAGFQANQVGNLVLIQTGETKGAPSEPLGLFNMMGQKVATLHPTGYMYQWNGRTAVGAEAQTGVYFIQAGNRILGKFFYTRQ
jgi:hypothetical protein